MTNEAAVALVRALMRKHRLPKNSHMVRVNPRLEFCEIQRVRRADNWVIELSETFVRDAEEPVVRNSILHIIACVLVGPDVRTNSLAWQAVARRLGVNLDGLKSPPVPETPVPTLPPLPPGKTRRITLDDD